MTPLQHRALACIKQYIEVHGYPPSTRELGAMLDGLSSSAVHRCLVGLEERGYIRRLKRRQRAIEIVDKPHLPRPEEGLGSFPLIRLVQELNRRGLMVGERISERDQATGVTRVRVREIKLEELNA